LASAEADLRELDERSFPSDVPREFIVAVFDVMVRASWHTFQVLTKRAERLADLAPTLPWPTNVWMGVSIENRRFVYRADLLRTVPAAVRFISAEPLLGPLTGLDLRGIDWLIAGGESGPKARPIHPEWVLDLRDRCRDSGVCFFFKQWGAFRPSLPDEKPDGGNRRDGPSRERPQPRHYAGGPSSLPHSRGQGAGRAAA
jgi:protein gp37